MESLTSILFTESSKEAQAKAFRKDIAHEDPELFDDLERQARLALVSLRNHAKPKQKVDKLKTLFSWNKELDPTQSGDTYGVRAFITALSKDNKEAGKAKRFYDRTVDAFFKGLYGDKAERMEDTSSEEEN
jgi:hypothetical protein